MEIIKQTTVGRNMRSLWEAETIVKDKKGLLWRLFTMKRHSGLVVTNAQQIDSYEKKNGFEGVNYTCESEVRQLIKRKVRSTEKAIRLQHEEAFEMFKGQQEKKESDA